MIRNCFHGLLARLSAVLAFSMCLSAQTQAPAKAAVPFDAHDLSGNWNLVSRIQTFSNVNPGGRGGRGPAPVYAEAPLTAAGRAKFETNKPGYGPRATPPAFGNDPMGTCDPLGIPRNIVTGWAPLHDWIDIVQLPNRMLQLIEWHHDWREIWTDGRQLPKGDELEPKWDGYSVGRWDGDTFVVDTIGLDERTWLDKFGYPHTDQARLQERWRRVDGDTMELKMTLTDPEYYSKPWESDTKIFKLHPEKAKAWDEQIYCAPSEEFKFNQRIRDEAGGKK
jgi:hypothetical protein